MPETLSPSDAPAMTAPIPLSLTDLLRVARAGLIVSHVWIYLLPAIDGGTRMTWNFWVGLAYVTVPLGLLIYGWNDYFDWDVDHASPRKNDRAVAAAFGPSLSRRQLASLPYYILAAQLPFALLWALTGNVVLVGWMLLMAAGNALYNGPGTRLSRVPIVAELTATGIYLLIAWLGILIHSPAMPWWSWLFAALSILVFQVLGTLVDVEQDAAVGKRTLSVAFGRRVSRATVVVFLLAKAGLTWVFTGHLAATAVMLAGVVLVASGLSPRGTRPSGFAYASSIALDWIWLLLMFWR